MVEGALADARTQPGKSGGGSRAAAKSDYFAIIVPASALWRTAPLLAARDDVVWRSGFGRHLWGWYIEPHPDGGVIVVATDGKIIGILREPEGRADRGCFILASDGLLKAVAPPAPITGYMEGDTVEVPARSIEVPGLVFASTVGCFIQHSGDYPADDADDQTNAFNLYAEMAEYGNTWAGGYRLIESGHGWRKIVEAFVQPEVATPYLDPALLAAFSRVQTGGWIIYTQADREAVYQVRHPAAADFVGYIMPCRWPSTPPAGLPDWLNAIKATTPASESAVGMEPMQSAECAPSKDDNPKEMG